MVSNKNRLLRVVFCITISIIAYGSMSALKAQNEAVDNQLWMDYSNTQLLSDKLSIGGDLGIRGFVSNYDWNQFYIRPTVTYRTSYNLSLSGALAYFYTNNKSVSNINEFRAHQQARFKWPDLGVIELFYRVRLEQRFFNYSEELANEFNNRIRLLVGLESMDFSWFGPKSPIYFTGTIEGFKTLRDENSSETFINRFRLDLAFGHRVSDRFRYEIHYIGQQSKLFKRDGSDTNQNIFRIRFMHSVFKDED